LFLPAIFSFLLIRFLGALELFLVLIDAIHESAENNGVWLFTIDVPAARPAK
jgi:hypothetical protein